MLVHAPSRGTRAATAPPEGGKPASSFRADIQGLRALAVALVVAYHAGLPIHGGFVGVDVFFVISGFVITRGVAGELERTGTVRLGRFAVRRIRRLLPALALMLTATMAFAIVASSSLGPQQAISATGHDAALFHANLGIYESVGDYFAPAAESNPLLHTWSLAVEEQFYAVFPLISLVLWRVGKPATGRRRLSIGYAAIAAVTLALSVAMVGEWYPWEVDHPQAFSYFATHYRAWEFLAGCLVALALADGRRLPGSAAKWSVLGLGAVVGSALLLDARTIFPGYAAVFPVAGTAALLAAGASPGRSHLGRALSARWVVGIGDLSYGWYLWHWPFIVFARELWPSTWWAALAAAALSLPVAAASQRLIENPIRFDGGERFPTLRVALLSLLGPLAASSLLSHAAAHHWGAVDLEPFDEQRAAREHCTDAGDSFDAANCVWRADDARGRIVLVGDSHATSISNAVIEAGNALHYDVAVYAQSSCPFHGATVPEIRGCDEMRQRQLALGLETADLVIIANRSPSYTLPAIGKGSADEPWLVIHHLDGTEADSPADALDAWSAAIATTMTPLDDAGIPVLVIHTVPEYADNFGDHVSILRPDPRNATITIDELRVRRAPVVAAERAVIDDLDHASWFDPAPTFCSDVCTPVVDGRYGYMDDHHLNPIGAAELVEPLTLQLAAMLPPG